MLEIGSSYIVLSRPLVILFSKHGNYFEAMVGKNQTACKGVWPACVRQIDPSAPAAGLSQITPAAGLSQITPTAGQSQSALSTELSQSALSTELSHHCWI